MKKSVILLSLIASFIVTGCASKVQSEQPNQSVATSQDLKGETTHAK